MKEIKIPIEVVQKLAGYKPTWDRVQGFQPLSDEGHDAIIRKYGSVEAFINQDQQTIDIIENIFEDIEDHVVESKRQEKVIDKNQLLKDAQSYVNNLSSHKVSLTPKKIRIENKEQKRRIAELEDYQCQVCGWSMVYVNSKGEKINYIHIDHIVDKSKKGNEEINNLWALCPNCHAKKTYNIIQIDPQTKKVTENGQEIKVKWNRFINTRN